MLVSLVSTEQQPRPDINVESVGQLIVRQGDRAWGILKLVLAGAAQMVIGLFVLVAGIYSLLIEGGRWYAWAEEHAPMGPKAVRRFAEAFNETGRGLMVGIGGAGLLQAIAATLAFVFLDVPQALALGLLTLVFSIVPAIGTAIVWIPVAAGLAITGRLTAGIGLAIYGIVVIGSIDNLARPWLTRYGKLQLPGFVVLVSMFGAVEVFGAWGILFGPLIVRLAKEALEIRREPVLATPSSSPSP
jgi:predicted PurR-regulated permease PerM